MSETKREKAKCVAQIGENNRILKTWRSIVDCAEELKIDEKILIQSIGIIFYFNLLSVETS